MSANTDPKLECIHHVGIATTDLERCIRFYRDLLGMQLLRQSQIENDPLYDNLFGMKNIKAKSAMLQVGNTRLELWQFERPRASPPVAMQPVSDPRITHICFVVANIHEQYERLQAAGTRFHCPPQDFGAAKVTYGRDPEGNIFELIEWATTPPIF